MSRKYDVIERHRGATASIKFVPTMDQLVTLCSSLESVVDLDTTSALLGMTPAQVLSEVSTLGTWLIRSKGPIDVEVEIVAQNDQRANFLRAGNKAGIDTLDNGSQLKGEKLVRLQVVIPKGFEPVRRKRDISKSLAAIVVSQPDAPTLARYIARTYPPSQQKTLTFSILSSVWKFAELKRLEEIDKVSPGNSSFMELIVEAFDVLDSAITRALEGAEELCLIVASHLNHGEEIDHDAVRSACAKAQLLNEAEIRRIESRLDLAQDQGGTRALVTELRFFAERVKTNYGRYALTDIAQLQPGQVRHIAESAGIDVGPRDRSLEDDIRARLQAMGISTDLDRLVPTGVRASQIDRLEDFFEAMALMVSGNASWIMRLEALFNSDI